MERRIVKTVCYSFISAMALFILILPYKIVEKNGTIETISYRPTAEYLYSLIWNSTLIAVLAVVVALIYEFIKRSQKRSS